MAPERLNGLRKDLGLSPEQVTELDARHPWLLTEGELIPLSLDGVIKLKEASGMSSDELMALFERVGSGNEPDRSMMMLLGNTRPMWTAAPTETRDDWIAIADRNIKSGNDEEYVRVWTEVRNALLQVEET